MNLQPAVLNEYGLRDRQEHVPIDKVENIGCPADWSTNFQPKSFMEPDGTVRIVQWRYWPFARRYWYVHFECLLL